MAAPGGVDYSDLEDWVPIALWWEPSGPAVQWCRPGDTRFVEPFFEQTVRALIEPPHAPRSRNIRVTSAEALIELAALRPTPPPSGFIFHASRCGSTLVTQILASVPRNLVLSEPGVVDSVLKSTRGDARLLRGVISALCRRRHGEERAFLKLTSRAMSEPDLPLIREAYPDVRWIFVYREPTEILASLMRASSAAPQGEVSMLPPGLAGAGLVAGDPEELALMPPNEFWTRVIAARFSAALRFYEPGQTLLLNYQQLPDAVWELLPRFFATADSPARAHSEEDLESMRSAAGRDAKAPSRAFRRDGRSQGRRDLVPAALESLVFPLYERLESLRLGKSALLP